MTRTGWQILTPTGTPFWALTRPTRRESIAAFEAMARKKWGERSRGWRCVRLVVSTKSVRAEGGLNIQPREPRADER